MDEGVLSSKLWNKDTINTIIKVTIMNCITINVEPIPPRMEDIMSPAEAIPRPLMFSFLVSLKPLREKINPKIQQAIARIHKTAARILLNASVPIASPIRYTINAMWIHTNEAIEQINPTTPAWQSGLISGKTFPQLEQTLASFSARIPHFGHFFININFRSLTPLRESFIKNSFFNIF